MEDKFIYLDNAASTRVDDEVLQLFNKLSIENYPNASSIHQEGQKGNRMIEVAKEEIKSLLKCPNHQVVITASATEANNLAIAGYALEHSNRGKHIITTQIEHPSVLEVVKNLCDNYGFVATYLKPNKEGVISVEQVKNAIQEDTILVSVMAVNNEVGAINPINEIANLLSKYPKIAFHSDLVQAMGKISFDDSKIDLFSIAGHKIHGLKGIGILVKKNNINLRPIIYGGGHEYNLRSGTTDLAGFLAFKKALEKANKNQTSNFNKVLPLYDRLVDYLSKNPTLYELNTHGRNNPYIVNFSLLTKKASVVVEALSNKGIMVSSVSSCHSKNEALSYVVNSMKDNSNLAHNTIRVSLDRSNTIEEIDYFIKTLSDIISKVRQ